MEIENLKSELQRYIDENFVVEESFVVEDAVSEKIFHDKPNLCYAIPPIDFRKIYNEVKSETFSEMLLRLIGESGEKNSAVYTRANIDRRHFSKIANNVNYRPSKETALAFAIALKLDFEKTQKFLSSAGYTMTKNNLADVIVNFFIDKKIFDLDIVNAALYDHEQPLLGG